MSQSDEQLAANVGRGVALLDEWRPGWAQDVDTETFDIGDLCRCTLGQLFGDYFHGLRVLGVQYEQFSRGFNAYVEDRPALTAEWRRVIHERQAAS